MLHNLITTTQILANYPWPQCHGVDGCHCLILQMEENETMKGHVNCPRLLRQWTSAQAYPALTFTYNPLTIYSSSTCLTTSTIISLQLRKEMSGKLQTLWRNNPIIQQTNKVMVQSAGQNSPISVTENVRLWSCLLTVIIAGQIGINLKGQ